MTMEPSMHPDDERLAALAGSDPDALSDRALTSHVDSCERCAPIVGELRALVTALSGLPDIAPPRALQLVPPVPAPPARATGGLLGLIRTLTAPAMMVAIVLVVVGAIGMTASSGAMTAVFQNVGSNLSGGESRAGGYTPLPQVLPYPPGSPEPASGPGNDANFGGKSLDDGGSPSRPFPFVWLLGAGVVLLGATFLVRGYAQRVDPG
jgi:hypothetical protein